MSVETSLKLSEEMREQTNIKSLETECSFLSKEQIRVLLEICDPGSTGLVSVEYLISLATQHCSTKEDADEMVQRLDPRGRGVLTYREFCLGVSTILRQAGGRESTMMGPSLEQQRFTETTKPGTPPFISASSDDVTLSSNDSNDKQNSRCSSMSEGESFECYGEVEMDTTNHIGAGGDTVQKSPNGNSLRRNTWQRTSLRKTGSNNHEILPNRRWGSFRLSSGKRIANNTTNNLTTTQLHRSSSFNSSGRSSTCDTTEDVYSDVSLEEDVLDLNHKVQMLQQQMNVLADNQNHSDERYTRAKQENATLQARVHMLEEQLREVEVRSEEKLIEEERRHRELVARVDREKQLQVENCAIRLQTLELENSSLKDESTRCRVQSDKLRSEKQKIEELVRESEVTIASLKEEILILREAERKHKDSSSANQQLIEELSMEVDRLRSEQTEALAELNVRNSSISVAAHEQLQAQFSALRDENRRLQEAHDEMQALLLTRSVEEGRNLLTENQSLAAELQAMSHEELGEVNREEFKMRTALKEQQEVNAQLRAYIDGILLNIVENYPQLLEVKSHP